MSTKGTVAAILLLVALVVSGVQLAQTADFSGWYVISAVALYLLGVIDGQYDRRNRK